MGTFVTPLRAGAQPSRLKLETTPATSGSTVSRLEEKVAELQDASLAKATKSVYLSRAKRYRSFCDSQGFEPYPSSDQLVHQVTLWIASLAEADTSVHGNSINDYIIAIRWEAQANGSSLPRLDGSVDLARTIKGFQNKFSVPVKQAYAPTLAEVETVLLHEPVDRCTAFRAAVLIMFVTLSRGGNICMNKKNQSDNPAGDLSEWDNRSPIVWDDITWLVAPNGQQSVRIRLRWRKGHNQNTKGARMFFTIDRQPEAEGCVWEALQRLRSPHRKGTDEVLAWSNSGKPWQPYTAPQFARDYRAALRQALGDRRAEVEADFTLSPHGLRAAGASFIHHNSAGEKADIEFLKNFGGWTSDAVWRYIRNRQSLPSNLANTVARELGRKVQAARVLRALPLQP